MIRSGVSFTRIVDADAFAECLARGVEHPTFQEHLCRPRYPGAKLPGPVELPIAYLLGPAGHEYCDGHRLTPVGGSLETAVANRLAWAQARYDGREPQVPEPTGIRLMPADFDGAVVIFTFAPASAGWQVGTYYPDPDGQVEPAMTRRYWQDNPDAPFAILLDVVETYCHPEAYDEAYDDLKEIVHLPERDPIFDRFKQQLAAAIADPGQVPVGALFRAAVYDDGSAYRFLTRLWGDVYPYEPVPDDRTVPSSP